MEISVLSRIFVYKVAGKSRHRYFFLQLSVCKALLNNAVIKKTTLLHHAEGM